MLLALRLYVPSIFFRASIIKISDWRATLALFHDEYKVPLLPADLAAFVGTFGELRFPVLIMLGPMGRFGAAGLFVVNVMAVVCTRSYAWTAPLASKLTFTGARSRWR